MSPSPHSSATPSILFFLLSICAMRVCVIAPRQQCCHTNALESESSRGRSREDFQPPLFLYFGLSLLSDSLSLSVSCFLSFSLSHPWSYFNVSAAPAASAPAAGPSSLYDTVFRTAFESCEAAFTLATKDGTFLI